MPDGPSSAWLLCNRRRKSPALRVYCFPHSGGSPGEYLRWSRHLGDDIELWAVQLPGRGSRAHEAPLTAMQDVVDRLVDEARFEAPYALFGHSMGAFLAYETARRLRSEGRHPPVHLVTSAYEAPHLHRPPLRREDLEAASFLSRVEELFGAVPDTIRQDQAALEAYLGRLRADLAIVATYQHVDEPPLAVPITAFSGLQDRPTRSGLEAWRSHTVARFDLRWFPGGHFFFRDDLTGFLSNLSRTVLDPADAVA
jgi:surfactin synthase thioesterase subunit